MFAFYRRHTIYMGCNPPWHRTDILIPCHIQSEPQHWIRKTAISYAAELDGHVLGTLCAVTMALLTNRLDLCIQGLFGAGKSKAMAVLILALLELHVQNNLKILFVCKENSGTRSFADLLLWLDPPSGVLGWSAIRNEIRAAIRKPNLTSTQEKEGRCSVSANL